MNGCIDRCIDGGMMERHLLIYCLLPVLISCICLTYFNITVPSSSIPPSPSPSIVDSFARPHYRSPHTISSSIILSTPWLRVENHTIRLPSSLNDDNNNNKGATNNEIKTDSKSLSAVKNDRIISNWLWVDIGDVVNILVHSYNPLSKSPHEFIVFRQWKYGVGEQSLSVVGGFIEWGKGGKGKVGDGEFIESPLDAAKRELNEEMQMKSDWWESLGVYRTDANRGAGQTYIYLSLYSQSITGEEKEGEKRLINDELEEQNRVYLSEIELENAVMNGEFKEIKWTTTVLMGLMRFKQLKAQGKLNNQ